jgi:DNA replication and repair protein RecF
MIIDSLAVQSIRNHQEFVCKISPNVTVVTGGNGSGKTSLIEAIYMALRGTSFRGTDKAMLRYDAQWWRIDLGIADDTKRTITFDSMRETGRKKFVVDDKISYRLSPAHKYPVVLFEPDDLRLISGSPARRRDFIDTLITQLDPQYGTVVRKYERALKQRNNLLKKQLVATDDLFVWNVALSEYGSYIVRQRVHFIENVNTRINDMYNTIARSSDVVSVHYSDTLIGNTKQKLMSELHAHHDRDMVLGYTSVGPHRHDLIFRFNNSLTTATASRGEIRTIILALKFLEVAIIEQLVGQKPIVLLDDVFGELDQSRQTYLLNNFKDHQIILTSASVPAKMRGIPTIRLSDT